MMRLLQEVDRWEKTRNLQARRENQHTLCLLSRNKSFLRFAYWWLTGLEILPLYGQRQPCSHHWRRGAPLRIYPTVFRQSSLDVARNTFLRCWTPLGEIDHRPEVSVKPLTLGAGPNVSGFIVQLVEHRTGNREVTGSNPVEVLNFFQASLRNCINCVYCDDHFFIFIVVYVVVQFYPWYKFYFPLLGMVMYGDEFKTRGNKI